MHIWESAHFWKEGGGIPLLPIVKFPRVLILKYSVVNVNNVANVNNVNKIANVNNVDSVNNNVKKSNNVKK